jgi:hypothetical protein
VKWQSVSTDPESVEVRIVNNNPSSVSYSHTTLPVKLVSDEEQRYMHHRTYPTGYTQTVKDGINTADNKFTIDSLPGVKPGRGYQVNIMSSVRRSQYNGGKKSGRDSNSAFSLF